MKELHGRYASYWNISHASCGHAWQGRFYSCPMDPGHFWTALRYAELNPVRAGLAAEAAAWPWSSAAAHCGKGDPDACLNMEQWRQHWSEDAWRKYLEAGELASELFALRRCTHTGRPLGSEAFTASIEPSTRRLAPRKEGRPRKSAADPR